ncbi:MAG: gliding motility-associated ABC transporter permease subunit GldF [Chitinophagaceae bacterium]|jgi:ABC-2 type transport system permease protein|nr:MAG: gliding motility-associated ABC transporter permease subunit GldF [Chitinophagaceae bacterium]
MFALFRKEINQLFSSVNGYLSVILFLVANGLFLLVFPDTNIFNNGYATLDTLFNLAPWIFLLLIPAATMRLFAEEWRSGTMELLLTRPLSEWQVIGGKYLSGIFLLVFALIPTVIYYFTIRSLAIAPSDVDTGAIAGSYIGLFLLGSVFTAIGLWASSVSSQSVAAFLIAVFTCYIIYTGFDALSSIPAFEGGPDYYLQLMGIKYHYQSISRGVIVVQDVIYFLSMDALFLYLAKLSLDKRKWE